MNINQQLRAISNLRRRDGINGEDESDILTWVERCGPDYDTERLSEKSRERITAIFNRYFN